MELIKEDWGKPIKTIPEDILGSGTTVLHAKPVDMEKYTKTIEAASMELGIPLLHAKELVTDMINLFATYASLDLTNPTAIQILTAVWEKSHPTRYIPSFPVCMSGLFKVQWPIEHKHIAIGAGGDSTLLMPLDTVPDTTSDITVHRTPPIIPLQLGEWCNTARLFRPSLTTTLREELVSGSKLFEVELKTTTKCSFGIPILTIMKAGDNETTITEKQIRDNIDTAIMLYNLRSFKLPTDYHIDVNAPVIVKYIIDKLEIYNNLTDVNPMSLVIASDDLLTFYDLE